MSKVMEMKEAAHLVRETRKLLDELHDQWSVTAIWKRRDSLREAKIMIEAALAKVGGA